MGIHELDYDNEDLQKQIGDLLEEITELEEIIGSLENENEILQVNNERLKELLENIICECNTATYNIKNLNL